MDRIVLCPNGKYALFSLAEARFTATDLTLDQLLEQVARDAAREAQAQAMEVLRHNKVLLENYSLYMDSLHIVEVSHGTITALAMRLKTSEQSGA